MKTLRQGIQFIKKRVLIDAPVEVCYQTWTDSPRLPEIFKRLVSVEYEEKPLSYEEKPLSTISEPAEVQKLLPYLKQELVPTKTIKHWLLHGPKGKLYEIENTVILDVPNVFYSTTSTDPNDISVQSSVLFSPDENHHSTLIEWQVSFWLSAKNGSMTQLVSDILETEDTLMEDTLLELKQHLESRTYS